MAEIPKSVKVKWPVGPHYTKWVKGNSAHAWVHYKLKSADWYLATLVKTSKQVGRMDRNAGVEMAIDGALTGLCSAFDAALSLLIRALETANGIDSAERSAAERPIWARAEILAGSAALKLSSDNPVVAALSGGDTAAPDGWLAWGSRRSASWWQWRTGSFRTGVSGTATRGCSWMSQVSACKNRWRTSRRYAIRCVSWLAPFSTTSRP